MFGIHNNFFANINLSLGSNMVARSENIQVIEEEAVLGFDFGFVLAVGDGIVYAQGLSSIEAGALVEIEASSNGQIYRGMVLNLELNQIAVVLFSTDRFICPGDVVRKYGDAVTVGVGSVVLGRVIDSLGNPLDGAGQIAYEHEFAVDIKAPGIIKRKSVNEPLQTGVKAIDSMIPIGRGQRELIIGDRQTGKTTVAINTMLMQAVDNAADDQPKTVFCIYVAIGQKLSGIVHLMELLRTYEALPYSTIVSATASESAAL
jgi:proton translocating ATP synthase F1 alpha subunit